MKVKKVNVPGGFLYVVESKSGQLSSSFVPVGRQNTKHKSQADMILELVKENGGMSPDSISKSLNIGLQRTRELCSKLKGRGLLKRDGVAYCLI